jgi:hypothetical protein
LSNSTVHGPEETLPEPASLGTVGGRIRVADFRSLGKA